ncbi:type 2 isopentenyl-diphosphate Delta-isomerase [Streptococcus sp. DD13]|uniref:type 2 isopentenyl-diphosphate Delta-isomerase n=1 Tax=Streptococcus sp. DD13 TaxID=1777881 RepID=UPI000793A51F|nr:type 2 isopentenyl-diphosphate Delta-isomerase [Streptococcus sp. DD13]KXT78005.1 Isopentenyl-diphosphate delta-isomerase, FMN-dependent [Streptococcus sp. DD13]
MGTNSVSRRKDQHIALANQQYHQESARDFEDMRFVHHSLPQIACEEIQLETRIAGLEFAFPFFVNAITGGSERAYEVNHRLARLARETGIALASGSVSAAMKDPSLARSFQVLRKENPDGVIFANLGAHHTLDNAKKAVDLLEADALQLHVNAPQEMVMPEGDRDFRSWLRNIEDIVAHLDVPVIVKEVGFGMSREAIRLLQSVGVDMIDISGTGGTDFAKIENHRRPLADRYDFLEGWGQSTVHSLLEAASVNQSEKTTIIASGGIKNGLDIVKSLALGASLVGMSNHFLHLVRKEEGLLLAIAEVERLQDQIRTVMALLGAKTPKNLTKTDILFGWSTHHWCQMRGIDEIYYANRSSSL